MWLHAVSVGEALSAAELIRRLRAACPWAPVFVSCGTVAGRALAAEKLAGLAAGVFYAPLDYRFAVRSVLRRLRPAAVVVMETEIWPNLYREARRAGAALIVVNGRISDRTVERYRRFRWFFARVLAQADLILAQSELDRERYLAIGAKEERAVCGGNLKFDFRPADKEPPAEIAAFLRRCAPAAVWIAASTMPPAYDGDIDEDDAVIAAFRTLAGQRPGTLLILAPRRPERFQEAAEKLRRSGLAFARRSQLTAATPAAPVLLLDSIGELSSLFRLADAVFMGGSLAARGGHNILEPAFFGRGIVVGPHMENFRAIAREFLDAGAMIQIRSADELAPAVAELLGDPGRRSRLGALAREAAERNRGAADRAVAAIARLADEKVPHAPLRWRLLRPLTHLWRLGGALRARRLLARQERLSAPVVSVGGITLGGTGKTPLADWLAWRLRERGLSPAILMRGYRRRAAASDLLLAPGEAAPAETTGDEAQIHLRRGAASVGIGADRVRVGRRMEERFRPDIFLLDDGFQHRRLARELDLVLIDALDPFGGGELPPLGRLREPLSALGRASAFLITRAEAGRGYAGLKRELARWNAAAPVFLCRVKPEAWVDAATGAAHALETLSGAPVAAFCGLANPASFRASLEQAGCRVVAWREFADHHRYSLSEIRQLETEARRAGADALVTTEKDLANLAERPAVPLYWLRIGLEVDGAAGLLALLPR